MARHDIRGLKIQDGTYVLTSKDIYNLNDNFIQISQEVFGTSSFARKIDKDVKENKASIEAITTTVGDLSGDYSQVIQDVGEITQRVSDAEGDISTISQKADSVTLAFNNQKIGTGNLIKNGRGNFSVNSWGTGYAGTTLVALFDATSRRDCGEGNVLRFGSINANETFRFQYNIPLKPGTTYTFSGKYYVGLDAKGIGFYIIGQKNTAAPGTHPYDYVREAFADTTYSAGAYKDFSYTFTTNADEDRCFIRVDNDGSPDGIAKYVYFMVMLEESTKAGIWRPHLNEIKSLTHYFDNEGYTIYDSNGAEILSISKGMANEQNVGRVDNVEDGYPMRLPFNIGVEVNQITQAVLKWDISSFRTYSKGAASGGGSTSGSGGSYSNTVGVYGWTQGLAADTDTRTIDTNNLGMPHSHTIATSKLGHSHSISIPNHSHSTPNHEHLPQYGILTTQVTSNEFLIYIDGSYKTTVNAIRGEVDLSSWITTNGWHTIELRSTTLKRIDANLFLKTYIRR